MTKPKHTLSTFTGITELGYDPDGAFYVEICNRCTIVLRHDEEENASITLYKGGKEVNRKDLKKKDLHLIDNVIDQLTGECE
jgi:hypothetical protein